ncbi:hypothetical protein [Pseudoruegeria sp. SHC-113]|uniref:hypothetical protein n=1 Tax=Pseudoruegeria sp. SHC-113 TaxID=2855439 RepID=UPI0021BB5A43|nr:hypothetical protein [Pseudoruegeria sp. SHC-113]MCT8160492.1 hypothetical protein [Pseudoruegeria sp. SHC-113]
MALAYTHTQDPRYLEVARNVADFFLRELPEDHVPHWDFRVPRNETTPRDTSAGMCAACGLLELAAHLEGDTALAYLEAANAITRSTYETYGNWGNDSDGLLRGGTINHPAGLGIDVSLIYGDYYYVEALTRLRQWGEYTFVVLLVVLHPAQQLKPPTNPARFMRSRGFSRSGAIA